MLDSISPRGRTPGAFSVQDQPLTMARAIIHAMMKIGAWKQKRRLRKE